MKISKEELIKKFEDKFGKDSQAVKDIKKVYEEKKEKKQ